MSEDAEVIDEGARSQLLTSYLLVIVLLLLGASVVPHFRNSTDNAQHRHPKEQEQLASAELAYLDAEVSSPIALPEIATAEPIPLPTVTGSEDIDEIEVGETTNSVSEESPPMAEGEEAASATRTFDLANFTSARSSDTAMRDGSIEVTKSVFAGGAEIGALNITIDETNRLFADKARLIEVLNAAEVDPSVTETLPDTGLISFQRIRRSGIDIRYDPVTDQISIDQN